MLPVGAKKCLKNKCPGAGRIGLPYRTSKGLRCVRLRGESRFSKGLEEEAFPSLDFSSIENLVTFPKGEVRLGVPNLWVVTPLGVTPDILYIRYLYMIQNSKKKLGIG